MCDEFELMLIRKRLLDDSKFCRVGAKIIKAVLENKDASDLASEWRKEHESVSMSEVS